MAASEKGRPRRPMRRDIKQQPMLERQEVARTPTTRGVLPQPRLLRARLPGTEGKRSNNLNWWEKLFGQKPKQPRSTRKELDQSKVKGSGKISRFPVRETNIGGKIEPSAGASSKLRVNSSVSPPFSEVKRNRGNRSSTDNPAGKVQSLPSKLPKSSGAGENHQKLVPLPSRSKRQSLSSLLPTKQHSQTKKPQSQKRKQRGEEKTASSLSNSRQPRQQKSVARKKMSPQPRAKVISPLVYATRLLILGIGLSVAVGTMLSIGNPASHQPSAITGAVNTSSPRSAVADMAVKSASPLEENFAALKLTEEIAPLKTAVESLVSEYPKLSPGIFVLDIDTGAYLDVNGSNTLAAASTIKLPILVAFFQDVDAGKISLDEKLTLDQESIASGAGNMQYKKPGTKFTALETATKMMTISDNTATNMIIGRLGGAEVLNDRFREWGLQGTAIRNKLPDIEGTNTTSAKELATLMARVNQGDLVSLASRDRMLNIMRRAVNSSMLPRGLGKGATIAHKTGSIGSLVGDVGLIDLPSGRRYIAAVMVERPRNDAKAILLINKVSRVVYQYFTESIIKKG